MTVTSVAPSGKTEPEAGATITVGLGSTRSETNGVKFTTRPAALVASATMGAGQVRLGAVVSRTVTVKVQALVFPLPSVAVTVTVVTPNGKVEPEAGFARSEASVQLSEAEGVKLTKAPAEPVASATMGAGQVTDGTVMSRKFTVAWQLAVKPLTLVAVKVTTVAPSPRKVPGAGL